MTDRAKKYTTGLSFYHLPARVNGLTPSQFLISVTLTESVIRCAAAPNHVHIIQLKGEVND